MRVALLSHAAPPGDAIGRQIAEKAAYFVDRGAEVRVLVTSDRRVHPALRPLTHRFSPAKPQGPHWQFLTNADLIFVEYSQHDPLFDLLPLLTNGARIIFDYYGVTPPDLGGANHRDALERGCRFRGLVWAADAAVAHSRFSRNELLGDTEFPKDRTHSIGLPIDSAWFSPGPPENPLRPRLGLSHDARLVLAVGRLAPNKRIPLLIEAIARLRDLTPAIHVVIVGDGGEAYAPERDRCRERAVRLGVADRIHFLGHVDERQLRDAYRDADVLAAPSVHEGFCIPVIEAMACGTPVVAARAAALPETMDDAGLTFTPDDADDLSAKLRRLFFGFAPDQPPAKAIERNKRIAVVAPRFGEGFVGGAETSLRILAQSMAAAGNMVEVFTTGAVENTTANDGLQIHSFRPDAFDSARHAAAAHTLQLPGGTTDTEAAEDFLDHSLRSTSLVNALRERGPFDAIVVGPYLLGLTRDVAEAFGDRVLLLPCFHDEPFARLPALQTAFANVGGILYHSPEERAFAQAELGFNSPNAHVIGTLIDVDTPGDPRVGRKQVGTGRRYILYCGRYCREKGFAELIGFASRYAADNPERFTFAFVGDGQEPIPNEPWARNLGFVWENVRCDVTAGADAMVLFSPHESLSLVTLEAQAQGVPVIVRAGNDVLEGHIRRGDGGLAVSDYEDFAAALDDLWADPVHWRTLGRNGKEYVQRTYTDPRAYSAAWEAALAGLDQPLAEQLFVNGRRRAKSFDRNDWREQFGRIVDAVLESPPRPRIDDLEITPRTVAINASVQQPQVVAVVRLTNRGQHVLAAEGPGRTELITQVLDWSGESVGPESVTPLPGLLMPGRPMTAIIRIAVPEKPADYQVAINYRRLGPEGTVANLAKRLVPTLRLTVTTEVAAVAPPTVPANLEPVLRAASVAQQLPSDYVDVSQGRFARWKHWIKRKLLHNFQTGYVDVLSRQQSAFNRQMLNALVELGDGQSALAHANTIQLPRSDTRDGHNLRAELRRLRRANRRLQRRLIRLEAALPPTHPLSEEAAA